MRHTLKLLAFVLALGFALPGPLSVPTAVAQSVAQSGRDGGRIPDYDGAEPPGRPYLEPRGRPYVVPPDNGDPRRAEPPRTPPGQAAKPPADAKSRPPGDARTSKEAAKKKKPAPLDTPEAREKALANLYAHLATAADPGEAAAVASAIEKLWVQSGSDTVGLLLSRATQAMMEKKTDLAGQLLDAVVDLAPDYAEGFARRAFFYFNENDTSRALGDLRRALALEPNHFRALDGLAVVLKEIGEKRAALKALRQLELVHPHWPGLDEQLKEMERAVEGQGI